MEACGTCGVFCIPVDAILEAFPQRFQLPHPGLCKLQPHACSPVKHQSKITAVGLDIASTRGAVTSSHQTPAALRGRIASYSRSILTRAIHAHGVVDSPSEAAPFCSRKRFAIPLDPLGPRPSRSRKFVMECDKLWMLDLPGVLRLLGLGMREVKKPRECMDY
jgi:hypothetical protein